MKEFPDDELDKLFRKSAEELDSNFDPQDWNVLKKRLDENDGRTTGAWLKKWWPAGLLAVLMFAGLIAYLLTNTNKNHVSKVDQLPENNSVSKGGRIQNKPEPIADNNLPEAGQETDSVKGVENNIVNQDEKITGSNNKTVKQNPVKTGNSIEIEKGKNSEVIKEDKLKQPENNLSESLTEERYRILKNKNQKALPRRRSKAGGVYLAPNQSIGRRGDGAFLSDEGIIGKDVNLAKYDIEKIKSDKGNTEIQNPGTSEHTGNVENNFPIVKNEVNNIEKINKDEQLSRLNISASKLKSRSLVWKKTNSLPEVEVKEADIPPVFEQVKAVSEKESIPKFAVRFSYSPDISSVGLKNFTKPGTAVSLLVEYAILAKLYIQSGVARSSKVYKANGGEYVWPSSWDDQTVRPYSTDATCKVIEIPLNLRYDITNGARSRWFVGAGVSSYYMQNEKYIYNYKRGATGVKWPDWDGSTGWYLLSHINASAGYEYRVSKKLSLLAEPYVRIPVKKVGFGKVDLFTTGVWFSIRYTPLFKK